MNAPGPADPNDPYSRANYRSLIAWPERIRREAPFLASALDGAPDRSVADLGCGTGEHAAHFASLGWRAAGLDRSESMLADARSAPLPPNLSFTLGDLREADRRLASPFGAAICLGNTLPSLLDDAELDAALSAVARLLSPEGRFLLQILNYEGLRTRGARHLPLNFRKDAQGNGETLFLRLIEFAEHGRVLFFPTTLRVDPDSESPVEIVRSRRVALRAWTRAELLPALERAGFAGIRIFGDMTGGAFDAIASSDLVVLAVRKA